MSEPVRFIHLRTHTEYSLLEGAVPVKKLVGLCAAQNMPAVAVTDSNAMFAALEFSTIAAGVGVQPIVGCQMALMHDPARPGEKLRSPAPFVLLAQSEAGYMNLMALSTSLYIEKSGQIPHLTLEDLEAHSEGVICLTGGAEGPVGKFLQTGNMTRAEALLARLAAIFPTGFMWNCSATPARAAG